MPVKQRRGQKLGLTLGWGSYKNLRRCCPSGVGFRGSERGRERLGGSVALAVAIPCQRQPDTEKSGAGREPLGTARPRLLTWAKRRCLIVVFGINRWHSLAVKAWFLIREAQNAHDPSAEPDKTLRRPKSGRWHLISHRRRRNRRLPGPERRR
ncbi:MAG: hypothetical protein MI923_01450 [Phycisphaerales bacterium]|nr:hypothetical protein [Phycisphaerales bacterium]